jgi:catechol 2,3-dioxygenase-like lactoylglutathione lyase family enzyme
MTQPNSRRVFLAAVGAAFLAPRIRPAAATEQVPKLLDHILLGCDNLDRGIAFVEEQTGVRAAFGGVHPGAGTHNALLSLGPNRYLEIIAPDPKQPATADARDLKSLTEDPALVGWAARPGDIDAFAARLKGQGFQIEGPMPGSRTRPDGRVLTWKVLRLRDDPTLLLPFFIEWSRDSIHPSVDSPQGCRLFRFEAFAPDADARAVSAQIEALGLDLPLAPGKKSLYAATIIGPEGQLELTS